MILLPLQGLLYWGESETSSCLDWEGLHRERSAHALQSGLVYVKNYSTSLSVMCTPESDWANSATMANQDWYTHSHPVEEGHPLSPLDYIR